MKIYILCNEGKIHRNAYINKNMAEDACFKFNGLYDVKEVEVPFVGKSVCYVSAYFGCDIVQGSVVHTALKSKIYSCAEDAKKDDLWIRHYNIAMKDPSRFRFDGFKLNDLNKTLYIDEFYSADNGILFGMFSKYEMAKKFLIQIKRIRVYR